MYLCCAPEVSEHTQEMFRRLLIISILHEAFGLQFEEKRKDEGQPWLSTRNSREETQLGIVSSVALVFYPNNWPAR